MQHKEDGWLILCLGFRGYGKTQFLSETFGINNAVEFEELKGDKSFPFQNEERLVINGVKYTIMEAYPFGELQLASHDLFEQILLHANIRANYTHFAICVCQNTSVDPISREVSGIIELFKPMIDHAIIIMTFADILKPTSAASHLIQKYKEFYKLPTFKNDQKSEFFDHLSQCKDKYAKQKMQQFQQTEEESSKTILLFSTLQEAYSIFQNWGIDISFEKISNYDQITILKGDFQRENERVLVLVLELPSLQVNMFGKQVLEHFEVEVNQVLVMQTSDEKRQRILSILLQLRKDHYFDLQYVRKDQLQMAPIQEQTYLFQAKRLIEKPKQNEGPQSIAKEQTGKIIQS